MNGINRVGQKVRCIESDFEYEWCPNMEAYPKLDKVYTVGGFEDVCQDIPGIHLNELVNTICKCSKKRLAWPIKAFRPIIEDGAKSKCVTAIIDKANKKSKVKERV